MHVLNGAVACGSKMAPAASVTGATATVDLSREVTRVLDVEALEGPSSIFRSVDPAELMSAFARDVEKNKALLRQAAATGDLALFRASIHALAGYAGSLGASRLQWMLASAPRDDAELRTHGPIAAAELCETIDVTSRALDEWLRVFICVAQ